MTLYIIEQLPETPRQEHFDISKLAAENTGQLAEGNGLKAEQVRLSKHDTTVFIVPGSITATIKPVMTKDQVKGSRPAGETASSLGDVQHRADAAASAYLKNDAITKMLEEALTRDAGKGWAMKDQKVALKGAAHKEYSIVDKCLKCNGAAHIQCNQCNMTGRVNCTGCAGRGRTNCTRCLATGFIDQQDGSRQSCTLCQQTGQMPCLACQGQKTSICPNCSGSVQIACTECDHTGYWTTIYRAEFNALMTFEADQRGLPPEVLESIKVLGLRELAVDEHAEMFRTPVQTDDKRIFMPYHAYLPVAKAEFSVEGRIYPCVVAGLKGTLMTMEPPLLDKLVKPGINALLKLSQGPLAADALIATACKYRLLRTTLAGLSHHSKRNIYTKLTKDYPVVLSEKYARAAVKYADLALLSIGQAPRQKGLVIGTVGALALAAGYFMTSARPLLLEFFRQKHVGQHIILADIGIWLLGYVLALYAIKYMAAQKLNQIVPQDDKDRGLPSAGEQGLYAWGSTFAAWATVALFAPVKPDWVLSILKMAGLAGTAPPPAL